MFPRNVGYEPPHQLSPIVTAILATSTAASPPVERLPRERYDRVSSPFAAERLTRRDTMFLNREDEDGDVPIHIEQSDITVDDTLQLGWKFPRATNGATVDTTGFEHQNGHSPHQQRSSPQSAISQTLVTPAATLDSSRATAPPVTILPTHHHDVSSVTIPLSSVEAVSFVDAEAWDSGIDDDEDNRTITAERGEMPPHRTSSSSDAIARGAGRVISEIIEEVNGNAHPTGDATAPLRRLGLPPRSPPPSHSVSLALAVNNSCMCNSDADQMAGRQDLQQIASTPSSVSPVSDTTDGSPMKRHYEHSSHVYSSDDDDDDGTAPGATAAKAHDQSFEAEVLSRRLANLRAEVDHMCFAVFLEASTSPAKESVDHAQHHYANRTQAPPSPLAYTLPPGRRVAARRERTAKRYESSERMAPSSLPTTQRSQNTHVISRPAHITTTTSAVVRRTGSPKPSQPRAAVKAAERVNAMKVERPPSPLPLHDMLLAPHVAASKLFPYQSTSATDESFRIPLGGTTPLQPPAYDDDEDQYPRSLDDVAFFSSYAKTRMVLTKSTMTAGALHQDSTVTAASAVGMLSTSSPAIVVVRQPLATSKTLAAKKRRNDEIGQNLVDVIPIERVKCNTATHRFPPKEDSSVPLPAVAATIETPKTNSAKIVVKHMHALISSNVPPTERRAEASHSATFSEEFLWTPVKRHEGPSPKEPHQQQVLSPLQQQHQKLRKHTKNHQPITTAAPSHTPPQNNNDNAVAFDAFRGRNNNLQRPNTSSGSNTNTQSRPTSTFLETSPPHRNAFTNEEQFVQFPSSTRREESPGVHSANSSITFAERSLSQHSVAAASMTTSTLVQEEASPEFVEHINKPHIPSTTTQHVTNETVDDTASVVLHDVAPAHIADAMAASNLSASSEIQFELFSSDDETSSDHPAHQEGA